MFRASRLYIGWQICTGFHPFCAARCCISRICHAAKFDTAGYRTFPAFTSESIASSDSSTGTA